MPVSGPFTIISGKGYAWNLRESSSGKNYVVHPDYIIQSAKQRKLVTSSTKAATDDVPESIDRQLGEPPPSPPPFPILLPVPENVTPIENNTKNRPESTGNMEENDMEVAPATVSPTVRIQPLRACKR